ncbi:MAG: hypothetical protein ACLUHG_07015 [Sutterella wadsworthensis]
MVDPQPGATDVEASPMGAAPCRPELLTKTSTSPAFTAFSRS